MRLPPWIWKVEALTVLLGSWVLTVVGTLTVVLGAWLLVGGWVGDRNPAPPHQDFAGPTDFSSLSFGEVALISICVIAVGCGFLGLGWWIRGQAKHPTTS